MMKRTIITIAAAMTALLGAASCTDYLKPGKADLTPPEGAFDYPSGYTFNHPCAFVSKADIERVRQHLTDNNGNESDPIWASWQTLCNSRYADITRDYNPVEVIVRGDPKNTGYSENFMNAARDAATAFQLALRWQLSADPTAPENTRYADRAVEILNAWADVCRDITSNDANYNLAAGFQGYQFANVAELLRDYEGWEEEDQNDFKQWLINVWYAKNYLFINTHGGVNTCNLHYWSNWELANLASILAIGIYTENVDMINFVYRNFREGEGSGCIDNMIPYAPVKDPDGTGMIAQHMESGRDQGHGTLVISMCSELCQMAYNIGIDFWGMQDNKVLAMCEYTGKYNLYAEGSSNMPFFEYKYCPEGCGCSSSGHGAVHTAVSGEGRGTLRPCWDLIYSHYSKIKRVDDGMLKYTKQFAEKLRYKDGVLTGDAGAGDTERYGDSSGAFDQIGWGTLLFYQGE